MMHPYRPEGGRHRRIASRLWSVLLFLCLSVLFFPGGAYGKPGSLIERLQASDVVVRARVLDAERNPSGSRIRAVIRVDEVIKGKGLRTPEPVVEERRFPSEPEQLVQGREAVLFLRSLPAESRWEEDRARGARFMLLPEGRVPAESGPPGVKRITDFLQRYQLLWNGGKGTGSKDYFSFLLRSLSDPETSVQEAAAEALPELDSLPFTPGHDRIDFLDRFIRDQGRSLAARKQVAAKLMKADAFPSLAPDLVRCCPELRRTVLDQLDTGGGALRMETLRVCLQDPDPQVRGKALSFLSRTRGAAADHQMRQAALLDPDDEIRARAVTLLADRDPEAHREVIARGLGDGSPLVVYHAAEAVRELDDESTVRELSRLLQSENSKVRFIGVLMLGSMQDESARSVLRDARDKHDDPRLRELCQKVLKGREFDAKAVRKALGTGGPLH